MSQQPDQQFGFTCAACGKLLRWRPELAGKSVMCKCSAAITVPDAPDWTAAAKPPNGAAGANSAQAKPGAVKRTTETESVGPAPAKSSPARAVGGARGVKDIPLAEPRPNRAPAVGKRPGGAPAEIDALAAAAERAAEVAAGAEAGHRCPTCLSLLPDGAVLCTQCGTDLRTGEKVAAAGAAVSPWAPRSAQAGGAGTSEDEADDEESDEEADQDPSKPRAAVEDLLAPDSTFRVLHLPLVFLAIGLGLSAWQAYILGQKDGGPVVARFLVLFVIAAVAMECVLLFAALLVSVKLLKTGLAGVGPALIRFLAVAVGPGTLGGMVQQAAGGGVGAMILAGLVSILLYVALLKLFFDLHPRRAVPLVIVVYLVENWTKPLLLNALLMGGTAAAGA
jgi:hypothetical protein